MRILKCAVAVGLLLLSGCSSGPERSSEAKQAKEKLEAQSVTAKTAYWEMFKSARGWATDIAALGVRSEQVPGSKNEDGKAAVWSTTFASASQRAARIYFYSAIDHAPEAYKGITARQAVPWRGAMAEALPFSDFSVDSSAAYKTAIGEAGSWVKKHPDVPVSMSLGSATRFGGPVWFVLWGDPKSGGYLVVVNASNGSIMKK